MIEGFIYKKPKKGDIVVCFAEEHDEDFGMSGIVLKGEKGKIIGKKYEIDYLDFSNVPKKNTCWDREYFHWIKWRWIISYVRDIETGYYFRTLLSDFLPSEQSRKELIKQL
jgi:hypothetical protein